MVNQEELTQFTNQYNELRETDKKEFSRIGNKLLKVNFLCKDKVKDKDDYYYILDKLQLFITYFKLLDYKVEYYKNDNVISISNVEKHNSLKLKKDETIILLILRKLYFIKMQEISIINQVTITSEELLSQLTQTNLIKNYNKTSIKEKLNIFKSYNIIDYTGSIEDDNIIIFIYPTIQYAIHYKTINEVEDHINSFYKGEQDEETSED
ncbi:MAG: DUF4194 domain-containing protein [Erysipelotrichaceae bacterium]